MDETAERRARRMLTLAELLAGVACLLCIIDMIIKQQLITRAKELTDAIEQGKTGDRGGPADPGGNPDRGLADAPPPVPRPDPHETVGDPRA